MNCCEIDEDYFAIATVQRLSNPSFLMGMFESSECVTGQDYVLAGVVI